MKNKWEGFRIRVLPLVLLLFSMSSCVSKKRFSVVLDLKASLDERVVLLEKENRQALDSLNSYKVKVEYLEDELEAFLKTSGSTYLPPLISSVQNKYSVLFKLNEKCFPSLNTVMSQVGFQLKTIFQKSPIKGTLRDDDSHINSVTRKWLFISSGKSDILKSNPRYETVIYIVALYFDAPTKRFSLDIDYVPLASGGRNDTKTFLKTEEQINLYNSALQKEIDNMINFLVEKNNCLTFYDK